MDLDCSGDNEPDWGAQRIKVILDTCVGMSLDYTRAHSPYYREKLAQFPPVGGVADLAKLPMTTKSDVSNFNERFWCVGREHFVDIATTSGTTGVPTLYPLTKADLRRLARNEFLCFSRAGIDSSDVVILAVTMDKCFMAGLAYFLGLRQIGATAVRVGAGSPAMLLNMMQRTGATAIVSVPSFLRRVADYAAEHGINLAQSGVKKLICIGEPIRNAEWELTPLAQGLAKAYGAQIFSTYGITELACSACECEAGQGGHLHPTLMHAEIVDDDGRPLPDGQVGQLVATSLGVEAMPLVRFSTGDMTFMTHEKCGCGLETARIGPILGRRDQAMKIKGTTVYPAAVQRALGGIEQVMEYVMIATSPTALCDELEVLVAWRGDRREALEIVREKLRGELKVTPAVRLADPQEIRSLVDSQHLRKQRVFIDRRGKPTA